MQVALALGVSEEFVKLELLLPKADGDVVQEVHGKRLPELR